MVVDFVGKLLIFCGGVCGVVDLKCNWFFCVVVVVKFNFKI